MSGYSEPVRAPVALAIAIATAALGGAAALGIAAGAGWVGKQTKTVVVNAKGLSTPTALPAAARSTAKPLVGGNFDPAKIYAQRSPGVVTIFAVFGDADNPTEEAQGSGFVISPKGYILTNSHVITNAGSTGPVRAADHVYVEFSDVDRVAAKVVGWDVYDDVGLVRVDPSAHQLTSVPLGSSAAVVVGEPVAAIGSPLGNENSLAVGVVSAVHRSIDSLTAGVYRLTDAIQTDAPITHGNSGGPLFDARGRVIGINAQIRSQASTGNDSGVGFAVPIDSAKRSVAQLIAHGRVVYAYVGVKTEDLTPAIARALGLNVDHGAVVVDVIHDPPGPAARAGLREGSGNVNVLGVDVPRGADVIVGINGRPVRDADDVVRLVSTQLKPGDVATFTIVRDGKRKTVPIRLGTRGPQG
jgi:S1-C subfamily serine protease